MRAFFLYVRNSPCNLIPVLLRLQHLLLRFAAESRSPWVNWIQSHMTEYMPTVNSSVCLCAATTECVTHPKRLSEGFVKTVASAVRRGVVVLASHAGPGRLTTTLTTTPVSMGLNSPICLARELLTQGGNLQRLSFPLPSSLVCLFIFLFVFMLPACPSFHRPRCHNDSRPTAHCSAAVAFINCELRHPNYHLQREQ